MTKLVIGSEEIVSSQAYGLILTSPHLQQMLLPQGILTSPYEVLDYDATLTLHDTHGIRATFQRSQQIRFIQDGVAGILDHAWGEGILLTNYQHSAGQVEDSFKDQGVRHLVIELQRPMWRGEELSFQVEREAMESFTKAQGILETTIDHPIKQLRRRILFPKARPVQQATLECEGKSFRLPIARLQDGRTAVGFKLAHPRQNTPYTVRWSW